LWVWLLALSAVLLPVDIGIRRLVITKSDLRQGWQRVVKKLRPLQPAPASSAIRTERIERLHKAKESTFHRAPAEEPKPAIATSPPMRTPKTAKPVEIPSPSETEDQPPRQDTPEQHQSTAAALLAKKKTRK
jgi:hypothetical protein